MFNVDNIYDIINANFLRPNSLSGTFLKEFGVCHDLQDIATINTDIDETNEVLFNLQNVFFYDQEPVYDHTIVKQMVNVFMNEYNRDYIGLDGGIFATSERSNPKVDALCRKLNLETWYYFYHAFASLDWFRSIKYLPQQKNIWQGASFISLNNLYKGPRIYRLVFLSQLYKRGLFGEGIISYNIDDWSEEIDNMHLDAATREDLITFCGEVKKSYRLQKNLYNKDNSSAEQEYPLWTSAFWHIVSETCFYEKTLHLTEKVFKPIVARQPFILLSTPGSLDYLRDYGFKTFSNVIDESYDKVTNPNQRINCVVNEIEKIANLTELEKQKMYDNVRDTVEYNFNHFYENLEKIVWSELETNFQLALKKSNETAKFHSYHKDLQFDKLTDISENKRCAFVKSLQESPSKLGDSLRKILK